MFLEARMNSKLLLAIVPAVLAGCATPRLEPVRVLSSDADTIQVQWNSVEVSEAVARRTAVLHCGTRRAEAAQARHSAWGLGLVRARTWRCVNV
jgi:hypothetical protein